MLGRIRRYGRKHPKQGCDLDSGVFDDEKLTVDSFGGAKSALEQPSRW